VAVHAVGLALILRKLMNPRARPPTGVWAITGLLVSVAWSLILTHLCAILLWAGFYYWQGCLPDAETAFYFSGVTYTTVGYGDVLLPEPWRMLGPVEGLAGILMCGLSTGLFFAVVTRIYGSHFDNPYKRNP
jgi:Ion channel